MAGVYPIACMLGYTPSGTRGRHAPLVDTPAQCILGYTHSHCPVDAGIHTPPCPVHAGIHPPAQCMLGYDQQACGTHPTGMHSCFRGSGLDGIAFTLVWLLVVGGHDIQQRPWGLVYINERGVNVTPRHK